MFRYILFCLVALSMISCFKKQEIPTPKKILKFNIVKNPTSLDPRIANDAYSITLSNILYEGLTRISPQGRPVPAGAKSIEISEDKLTYTFKLRETKWSNGSNLTAYDYEKTWKSTLTPIFPSPSVHLLYSIKNARQAKKGRVSLESVGIKAINEKTLEVTLEHPIPYFLQLTSLPVFFPVNIEMVHADFSNSTNVPINNGPFSLVEWKEYDLIKVQKNDFYWDSTKIRIDGIDMTMVKREFEIEMFKEGQLDWAGSPLSSLKVEDINNPKNSKFLHSLPSLGTFLLRFNTSKPPFNNAKIRKAFAYAINRKALLEENNMTRQIPALGLLPPKIALQQSPYFKDGDIVEAKRLLDDGLEELKITKNPAKHRKLIFKKTPLPIRIYSSPNSQLGDCIYKTLRTILKQWEEAFDIEICLENMTLAILYDKMNQGNYQMAKGLINGFYEDPIFFMDVFIKNQGENNTFWKNKSYVMLLKDAWRSDNNEERLQYLHKAESLLMEEMPIAPIFFYTFSYLKNPKLMGVYLSECGYLDFRWAYFL